VRGGGAAVGPISHLIFPDRSDRPSSCGSHRNSGFRGASATPFGSPRTADNWICLPGSGNQTKWILNFINQKQRRKDGDKMRPHSGLSLRLSGIWALQLRISGGGSVYIQLRFASRRLTIHSAPMGQSFELRLTGLLTVAFECRPAATGSYNPQLIELHYQSA